MATKGLEEKKFNVRPSTNMSKEVNFGKIACRKCEEGLKSQEITLRWNPLPKMVTKTLVLITLTTAILHEAPFFPTGRLPRNSPINVKTRKTQTYGTRQSFIVS